MPSRGGKVALAALCTLTLVGVVGLLGYSLRPAESPDLLRQGAAETSAPVVSQSFSDVHKVQVRLVTTASESLMARTAGTVTASSCENGGSITSGGLIARINDQPLIGLHTSVPLYRDLEWGNKGADVKALQAELLRLGYLAEDQVNGKYERSTFQAVQKLRVAAGAAKGDGVAHREEFVWLPTTEIGGVACQLRVGDIIGQDAPVATAQGAVQRLEIVTLPTALTSGDRTLTLQGISGPVSDTGVADDPDFLAEITANKHLLAALRADTETTITADFALRQEIDAYTVPVGALIDDKNMRCVQVEDTTLTVNVLGSRLGTAVVAFLDAGNSPPKSVNIGGAVTKSNCESSES